jgi:hypothetical protein
MSQLASETDDKLRCSEKKEIYLIYISLFFFSLPLTSFNTRPNLLTFHSLRSKSRGVATCIFDVNCGDMIVDQKV